jgi:hypothetical protein
MYEEGVICPAKCVVDATKELVLMLGKLEPLENIEIAILSEDPIHAQYIRSKTHEILAEIVEPSHV